MWRSSERYPCAPASPARARAFCNTQLRAVLGGSPEAPKVISTAELIVSELLTNAVNANCKSTELALSGDDHCVRIEVDDDGVGMPTARQPQATDERGRGLMIVDALAIAWGVSESTLGKRVWAEVSLA